MHNLTHEREIRIVVDRAGRMYTGLERKQLIERRWLVEIGKAKVGSTFTTMSYVPLPIKSLAWIQGHTTVLQRKGGSLTSSP